MFRRQEDTLDPDATYPADLKVLGYFIDNTNHGCIRNSKAPDQFFDFYYTNNERHNEVRGEAMRICQREEVLKRVSALGIKQLYLPTLTNTKPNGPHIPILAPSAEVLKTRKRVIVLINDDTHQDLGILAYRELQRNGGVNGGSIVNFLKDLITRNGDVDVIEKLAKDGAAVEAVSQVPGLIVVNTAQLLYSHKFNKAMNTRSWIALPRKSISHDAIQVHPVENYVEGHRTPQEHIKSVFNTVIKNPKFVAPDAEVYVIAIESGVEKLVEVLNQDFWKYGGRITAMAAIQSHMRNAQVTDPALRAFLHMRTRQWEVVESNTTDCTRCTSLPTDYKVQRAPTKQDAPRPIEWLKPSEPREQDGAKPEEDARQLYANSTYYVDPSTPQPETRKLSVDSFILDTDPICPTFAGGDASIGECIFTQRMVQQTIMNFFEEAAQDPMNFCNPAFKLDVPAPTPDNPFTLSADEAAVEAAAAASASLPQDMLSEEAQVLAAHREILADMKTALRATPSSAEFAPGRERLESRIARKKAKVVDLEKKALATGGLGAGAAQELRDKWENGTNGEKWVSKTKGDAIPFAGVEADSEVVKGAGCLGTVEEELARLGM
ncbi:hypothetical protein K458DRAFT_346779 [Lentithecium fluviatile CBS 122367]|uniref:Arb2 domain-containing protein n=1 Tax=Lentithecium fluviatile CBS 122367 TaxID=1168545 RepID=A0A6G1IMI0_9PLEO|nr:hypothetical protein K458DRAFT_346779 [Lentithecium fluviatile CBS 122367]